MIVLNHEKAIVIGIDGGGTKTRALAVKLDGTIAGTAESGCCNPNKDQHASEHVQQAIREALHAAQAAPEDVAAICAGLAGLEAEEDLRWAEQFTSLAGISCLKQLVNDAYVAHAGAFCGEPGIMAISGTGSVVFGINEQGRMLRNQDYQHYAGAARHLAYECVHRLLAGYGAEEDQGLLREVLAYWKVNTLEELYERGSKGFVEGVHEQMRGFGQMGPIVTRAAAEGSPVAIDVCNGLVHALEVGIRLIGAGFRGEQVPVAFMGSVIQDRFMTERLTNGLQQGLGHKQYTVVQPRLLPAAGAALLALKLCESPIRDDVLQRLEQYDERA